MGARRNVGAVYIDRYHDVLGPIEEENET